MAWRCQLHLAREWTEQLVKLLHQRDLSRQCARLLPAHRRNVHTPALGAQWIQHRRPRLDGRARVTLHGVGEKLPTRAANLQGLLDCDGSTRWAKACRCPDFVCGAYQAASCRDGGRHLGIGQGDPLKEIGPNVTTVRRDRGLCEVAGRRRGAANGCWLKRQTACVHTQCIGRSRDFREPEVRTLATEQEQVAWPGRQRLLPCRCWTHSSRQDGQPWLCYG